jgi:hypothetical protein
LSLQAVAFFRLFFGTYPKIDMPYAVFGGSLPKARS